MRRLNIIGSVLVKIRQERGWSQEIMAARLQREGVDVSRQMLANMECGRTQITDKVLVGCQRACRIPLSRFFPSEIQSLDEQFAQREKDQINGPPRHRR